MNKTLLTMTSSCQHMASRLKLYFPGVVIAVLVALAAQFVAEHYGAPAMLMALLFGITLNFLSEDAPTADGIGFAARSVLRFGVAILGARISVGMLASLGWGMIALLVLGTLVAIMGMVADLVGANRKLLEENILRTRKLEDALWALQAQNGQAADLKETRAKARKNAA